MRVLFVDTSQKRSLVALIHEERESIRFFDKTNLLFPELRACLLEADLRVDQFDACVAGAGPGSFTGIRVGVAAFQALSFSQKKTFFMVNSLSLYCQEAPVVVDARSGGFYFCNKEEDMPKIFSEEEFRVVMERYPVLMTPSKEPLSSRLANMGYRGGVVEAAPSLSTLKKRISHAMIHPEYRAQEILYLKSWGPSHPITHK